MFDKIFKIILCSLLTTSCLSYPYVQNTDKGNFKGVETGKTYTFLTANKKEQRFKVNAIESDTIKGADKKNNIALAKKDIKEIRKNNIVGTIGLASGIIVAGTAAILYISKLVGDEIRNTPIIVK